MLPNITADVIEKQKILQPGNCVGFGGAFKLPMVVKLEMPNPAPNSNSCDVNNCWKIQGGVSGGTGTQQPSVTPSNIATEHEVLENNDLDAANASAKTVIKPSFVTPL